VTEQAWAKALVLAQVLVREAVLVLGQVRKVAQVEAKADCCIRP